MDAAGPMTILKRDALGRVTLPRDQWEALIAEFERSGLRGTQFDRTVGINYGTFASWMQDRRHARGICCHSFSASFILCVRIVQNAEFRKAKKQPDPCCINSPPMRHEAMNN